MKCDTKVCRSCFKKYIENSLEDAHCMACSAPWGREFLIDVMPKVFLNREYRHHREKIMFDQQKSLLTSTLPYVESNRKRKRLNLEKNECMDIISQQWKKVNSIERELYRENRFYNSLKKPEEGDKESFTITGHCVKENCNGLIDQTWKCTSCDTKVCKKCMKYKEEGHICKDEDIESMKLIRSDSKPCPSCKVRIHLYEGCNQAWCTNCNTAFNWRTMKLIRSGFFHNPHFAEWQVKNGHDSLPVANYNENGRDNCITFSDISWKIRREFPSTSDCVDQSYKNKAERKMRGYLMGANHILDYETDERTEDSDLKLRNLRVEFLLNQIDEKQFKELSQRVDKARNKRKELAAIFAMYGTVARDILSRWAQSNEISWEDCDANINRLYDYTRSCIVNTNNWYNPFYKKDGYFTNNIFFN
jgi:hypothetical protein